MTPELATAYMAQLERVRHLTPFKWRNVTTDGTRGQVTIVTIADTPTVAKWLACVGLVALRFDRDMKGHAWNVTFVEAKREGEHATQNNPL